MREFNFMDALTEKEKVEYRELLKQGQKEPDNLYSFIKEKMAKYFDAVLVKEVVYEKGVKLADKPKTKGRDA